MGNGEAGFSLIEVLVSMVLFSIFLSVLFFIQLQSVRITAVAEKNLLEANKAQNLSERLHGAGFHAD